MQKISAFSADAPHGESNGKPDDAAFVLGVDLDGVCADFYRALRPIAAEWLGVPLDSLTEHVTYGLGEWELDSMGGYEQRAGAPRRSRARSADCPWRSRAGGGRWASPPRSSGTHVRIRGQKRR